MSFLRSLIRMWYTEELKMVHLLIFFFPLQKFFFNDASVCPMFQHCFLFFSLNIYINLTLEGEMLLCK